jgi:hypothetical protein
VKIESFGCINSGMGEDIILGGEERKHAYWNGDSLL